MRSNVLDQLAALGFPFPINGGDHDPDPDPDPKPDPKTDPKPDPEKIEFDEKQQKEVDRIVAREKKRAADKARDDALAEIQAQKTRDEEERQRKKDEDAGEFDKVKASLEKKAADAETSLKSVTEERDALLELVKTDVEASWNEVPEEVREAYAGAEDDVLAKKQFMQRNAKVIARLTETPNRTPGARPNPKSGPITDEEIKSPISIQL